MFILRKQPGPKNVYVVKRGNPVRPVGLIFIDDESPDFARGAQQRLSEGHLDRVKVRTVGREIEQACTGSLNGLSNAMDLVSG